SLKRFRDVCRMCFLSCECLQGANLRWRPRSSLRVLGHQITSQPKRTNVVAEGSSSEKPSLCKARRLWQKRLIIGIGSTITTKNVTSSGRRATTEVLKSTIIRPSQDRHAWESSS